VDVDVEGDAAGATAPAATMARYVRESIWEGNDVDTPLLSADRWWGRNGPRITLYRNRVVGSGRMAALETNRDKDGTWPTATDLNWIGNTSAYFWSSPPLTNGFPCAGQAGCDMDRQVENMHIEKNRYRQDDGFLMVTPEASTNCGTGVGDCPGAKRHVSLGRLKSRLLRILDDRIFRVEGHTNHIVGVLEARRVFGIQACRT
jgi:hypothetical protein